MLPTPCIRTHSTWNRGLPRFCVIALLAAGLCPWSLGCQGTRSAMQMDSDSKTPFFSFQVPVKHEGVETAIEPAAGSRAISRANNDAVVQSLALQQETPSEPSRWSRWIGRLKAPKSIPLPRTDINEDGEVVELEPVQGSVDDF